MVDNDPYDGDDDDDAGFDDDVADSDYNDYDEALDENPDEEGKWTAGLNVLLGLWLIVAPFVWDAVVAGDIWADGVFGGALAANPWNDMVVGAAIAVLAAYNFYRAANEEAISVGVASLVALLGLWLVVAPFIYDTASALSFWNDIVVGALVAILAGYNIYTARDVEETTAAEA
ncbi:SPW repeat domain-containing protein [Halorussus sp. AFM4]|uniref:SPW repeat domain-containing protein n=1 Tax=Halorussus sp. AFM4 TaxID=3421651 RepID=UPI003EC0361E